MGLLDSMAEATIKTSATGQRLYFPFGMFGRARIVPNEQEENKIKTFAKRSVVFGSISGLILIMLKSSFLTVLIAILLGLIMQIFVNYIMVRKYMVSDERMTWADATRMSVRKSDRRSLWVFFGLSLVMTLLSVFIAFANFAMKRDIWDKITLLSGVAFFGAGALFFLWMIRQAGRRE
ncbi:hypothetical protein [Azospirillum argentinense]|uniref:hypothetical protein n=1 Tax=Azospirillum argentinense TaxID=2970906 RepID=UPI0032DEDB21